MWQDGQIVRGCTRTGLGALVALLLAVPASAAAATYTVSSTADQASGSCNGALVCTSLRAAIANAPGGSTIQLGAGTYSLTDGHLAITQSLTIAGADSSKTTIKQNSPPGFEVLYITGGDVTLSGLTVTGGQKFADANASAGGIYDSGTSLTLNDVAVTGNGAIGLDGSPGSTGTDGADAVGGIEVSSGSNAPLTLNNSSVTNNSAFGGTGGDGIDGGGGGTAYAGITDLAGPVTINNSTISGNRSTGGTGGGGDGTGFSGGLSGQADGALNVIAHAATDQTIITDSTIDGNTTTGGTGGAGKSNASGGNGNSVYSTVSFSVGKLTIRGSTISGNTTTVSAGGNGNGTGHGGNGGSASGAGVELSSGTAAIVDSTISGNTITASNGGTGMINGSSGDGLGGGIADSPGGPLTLVSDTITGNSAQQGGNIDIENEPLTIADTILSAGAATFAPNCNLQTVTETDDGYNLEDTTPSSCGLSSAKHDVIGANPLLVALTANGGPTPTLALATGSPALDAGGTCTDPSQAGNPPLTVDQRGLPRANPCDIGALEDQPPANVTPPQIVGQFKFGLALTCQTGGWSGDGIVFSYQWLRAGVPIPGDTHVTYSPAAADFGPQLGCRVTATGPAGSASATTTVNSPPQCNCGPAPHAPHLSKAAESHSLWRLGNALARISRRHKAKPPPVGTTFSFVLDRAATVRLLFTQQVQGRKNTRGRCVFITKSNRHRKHCTLTFQSGTLTVSGQAGTNKVAFQGRTGRHYKIPPGSYVLSISASIPGAPPSNVVRLRFTAVR